VIHLQDIKEAYKVLATVIRRTPLEHSKTFSHLTKANVFLKEENLQTTGSFKIRGAYNKIHQLTASERRRGVVCASAGNHAQGVAYASTLLGVKSVVFMPVYTPPSKIIATKSYGATVVLEGTTYDDAAEAAKKYAKKYKMTFVHAFNDPYVIAGQGTIGIENLAPCKSNVRILLKEVDHHAERVLLDDRVRVQQQSMRRRMGRHALVVGGGEDVRRNQ
jgi:threonine dehydratase